jgi:hypothetical protein
MIPAASAFTYDELDELFRGKGGPDGNVGMSSIDGMIAALVAGPSFIPPRGMAAAHLRRQNAEGRTRHR